MVTIIKILNKNEYQKIPTHTDTHLEQMFKVNTQKKNRKKTQNVRVAIAFC